MKIVIPKNTEKTSNPTNYVILTDSSGSMYHAVRELKQTILAVKDLMGPKDTLTIGDFSGYGDYQWFVRGLPFNSNVEKLVNAKISARGLTCYVQALNDLPTILDDVQLLTGSNNFVFYFLSDGCPNDRSPESEIFKICNSLKSRFVQATVVGYGSYYNREILLNMALRLGGNMNHVSNYREMEKNYKGLFGSKKTKKNIPVSEKYDVMWQVNSTGISILSQNSNNSVDVWDSDEESKLYGINMNELDVIGESANGDATLAYSLAYVLSQQNKANLGVQVLRKAGALNDAKMLQKAFTVMQKGKVENSLKDKALKGGIIEASPTIETVPVNSFVENIRKNLGKLILDLSNSNYSAISRKGGDASKVKFVNSDENATVVGITGNEDRANISFLTVRKGQITDIMDDELKGRIDEYNKITTGKKITLPIPSSTYRNYSLIANGDFNFETLCLKTSDEKVQIGNFTPVKQAGNKSYHINPEMQLDLFDSNVRTVHIKDFVSLYRTLIEEKAHASVLRFYIKKYSDQKHLEDKRVDEYGAAAVPLLEEMGLDYQLRYAPKREYKPKDETADFVPFLEIGGALKGAATINAKTSYEKYEKKGKQNPGDAICWPLFIKYDKLMGTLPKKDFIELLQKTLEGVEDTVDLLSQKISALKFYIMITNSWFDGVPKADEFEYDGLVIKVKEIKEYL